MVPKDFGNSSVFSNNFEQMHHDYKIVVISNVMHHVPKTQRQQLIEQIGNRIGRSGMVVIFEHNPVNPLTRWVVNHCPFDKDVDLLMPKEVIGYLVKAHLSIWRRDYLVFFPRILSFLRGLEPLLSGLPLGAQYALIGERHA